MSRVLSIVRVLYAAVVFSILTGVPAFAQEPLRLDISQARVLAERLYLSHQFLAAREVALGLLSRDASDIRALVVLSQSERALGNPKPAENAGKRAWKAANNPLEKYGAALVTAQAISIGGARTRAQFWLRRAIQAAPNKTLEQRAIHDFRYVQGRNPFTTNLHFSARPSSNINNGSKSDTLVIGGLPYEIGGDNRALSGIEFSYGASIAYKKQTAANRQWRFGLSLDARTYALSAEAKRQALGQSASDYAFLTAEASLGTTKILDQGRGQLAFDLALGRNWYSSKALSDFARVSVARTFHRTPTSNSRYQLSVTRQWRKDNSLRSSTQIALTADWAKALKSGSVLRWNLKVQDTASASSSSAQNGVTLGASLTPKNGLFGTQTTYSIGHEARRYDLPSFGVLRTDNKTTIGVSLFFHKFDYYGFSPTLSVTAARNQSNVSLYDTTEYGFSVGFRSTF